MSDAKKARQARYRERNRERLRQYAAEYRLEHPEDPAQQRKREQRKAARRKKKKLTDPLELPKFAAIDGEAHVEPNGRSIYSYLRASGLPPLISRGGFTTKQIFEYLFKIPPRHIIVGFVLNYDWENWLKDIPDTGYKYLTGDMDVTPGPNDGWQRVSKTDREGNEKIMSNCITWEGYTITYYPKKIMTITKPTKNGKTMYRKIMDVWGYCQSSFLKACEDWQVATKEELAPIIEGKEKRDVFTWEDLETTTLYNELELELMEKLAENILKGLDEACRIAGLPIRPSPHDLYGPGAVARKLLKETGWPVSLGRTPIPQKALEQFLPTVRNAHDETQKNYLQFFPVISCYYGGRIEAAATGRFKKVYDYDLHSAYPAAITRLPFYPKPLTWKRFLSPQAGLNWTLAKRPIGMFYVMWHFPAGWQWYPFPTRQKKYDNVFYPRNGQGWVSSTELFAALDSIPPTEWGRINIYHAWTWPGLYGWGGGEKPLPEEMKSNLTHYIEKMYVVRMAAKKEGKQGAQLALKLILNSMYGKLLQQVGVTLAKPGHFHDLVASWITSWTRAMIYRAIAPYRKQKTVLVIQTDGIVTKKPLPWLALTPHLADWEVEELTDYRQLLPGLYDYQDGVRRKVRRRGMPKTFNFEKAWDVMSRPGDTYQIKYRTFLARRLYLAQPYKHEGMLYQWPEMEKTFRPDLGAKRGNPNRKLKPGEKFGDCYLTKGKESWLPPKINNMPGPGKPFKLKFDQPSYIPLEDWEIEQAMLEESTTEGLGFFRE